MKLSKLLERLEYSFRAGSEGAGEKDIVSVVYDSRKAEKGSLFVCIEGVNSDGHSYIPDVAAKGVSAVMVRKGHELPEIPEDIAVIETDDTRIGLAAVSAA